MSSRLKAGWTGLLHSRKAAVAAGIVTLLGLLIWLAPRPVQRLVPVDRSTSWTEETAPLRTEIAWLPARELAGLLPEADAELVSPTIDSHGAVLLFSRRTLDRQTDIYISRLVDGVWQPAEPLAAVNTAANELRPVLSRDGTQLFFYSDRPGGQGGADLYVATRTTDGSWNAPRNLGPSVNSAAHEYDPAIAPDGLTLYFASNRTEELARQIAAGQQANPDWNVTLRAPPAQPLFDLYRARRPDLVGDWEPSQPLPALSQPDSTDGAPFVSPNGAFLYFASDRAARPDERRNLDLYRARLSGEAFLPPENLGPGINTAAHETEPSLTDQGFTIVFSSNRDGADRLYASTATEIVREREWNAANWYAVQSSGLLLLFLLLLVVTLLAGLYYRHWLSRKVWAARFFLGSILVNLIVLVLLAVWKLPEIVDVIVRTIDAVPAPEFVDENAHQSHEDGRQAYEKVADLKSLETVPLPEIARQETAPLSVPERTEQLVPTIPVEQARALPPERVMLIPSKPVAPLEPRPAREPFPLTRQPPRPPLDPLELPTEPPQELAAVPAPQEQTLPAMPLEVARGQSAPGSNELPELPIPNPVQRMQPAAQTIAAADPLEDLPLPTKIERPLPRVPAARPVEAVADLQDLELAAKTAPVEPTVAAPATPPLSRTEARLNSPTESAPPAKPLPPSNPLVRQIKPQQTPDNLLTENSAAPPAPVAMARPRPALDPRELPAEPPPELTAMLTPQEQKLPGTSVEVARGQSVPGSGALPELPQVNPLPRMQAPAQTVAAVDPLEELPLPAKIERPLPRTASARPAEAVTELQDLELAAKTTPTEPLLEAPLTPQLNRTEARLDSPAASAEPTKPLPPLPPGNPLARQIKRQQTPDSLLTEDDETAPAPPTLSRNRPGLDPTEVQTPAETVELAGAELPEEEASQATVVELARAGELPLAAPVTAPDELTGPATHLKHQLLIGQLSETRNQAPPSFSPLANRLNRPPARAARVAFAEDNVGLKELFTLRQGDLRRQYIELLGGTEQSEKAVNLGLEWLAKNQEPDGSWDLRKHGGGENSRCAGTGLGLLPFLAAGYTHNKPGQYQQHVAAAVRWLTEHQQASGSLLGPGDGQPMYSHGIAAIALCEAYGISRDEALQGPARKALDFIAASQHQGSGGWRYSPNESADTSVVGWQVMALKSGEMAGLTVAPGVYDNVHRWLQSVEGKPGNSGTFGYVNRSFSPAMTAEGLLNLQFLGVDRNDPRMRAGADYLLVHLPRRDQQLTSYYWYYGTQVMYHMQGRYWQTWNESLRDLLVETQIPTGEQAGTWNPADHWEQRGGRVYATSLKLLMLEVYYRHLPLYEQLEE